MKLVNKHLFWILLCVGVAVFAISLFGTCDLSAPSGREGASSSSSVASDRVPGVAKVTAVVGDKHIILKWSVADTGIIGGNGTAGKITSYTVYYAEKVFIDKSIEDKNIEDIKITDVDVDGVNSVDVGTATSLDIKGLENETAYYFAVVASNATGTGALSEPITATPLVAGTLPSEPQNVSVVLGDEKVTVKWNAPSNVGTLQGNAPTTITGYTIYYAENSITDVRAEGVLNLNVEGTVLSKNVTGLTNGKKYYFVVAAINGSGEGKVSAGNISTTPLPSLSRYSISYNDGKVIVIKSGTGGTAGKPVWKGEGAPTTSDGSQIEYRFRGLPPSVTRNRTNGRAKVLNVDTGEFSFTSEVDSGNSGNYIIKATAKPGSGYIPYSTTEILVTVEVQ